MIIEQSCIRIKFGKLLHLSFSIQKPYLITIQQSHTLKVTSKSNKFIFQLIRFIVILKLRDTAWEICHRTSFL